MGFSLSELKGQLPFLEKISPNEWMEKLDQLNTRERNLVLGAIFGVIALFLYLSVSAGLKKLDVLDKQLKTHQTALSQVEKLSAELRLKEEEGQKLQTRIVSSSSGFILASHMEKEAQRYRVALAKTLNETRNDIGDIAPVGRFAPGFSRIEQQFEDTLEPFIVLGILGYFVNFLQSKTYPTNPGK